MHYCKWNEQELKGLKSINDMVILYAEIDSDGKVRREIGLNQSGKVVHKFPSVSRQHGTYGLFDNQIVQLSIRDSGITKDEFEKLWEKP